MCMKHDEKVNDWRKLDVFYHIIFILRRRPFLENVVEATGITHVLSDPKDQYWCLSNAETIMYCVDIACSRPQASHSVGRAVGMYLLSGDVKRTCRVEAYLLL